MRAWRNWKAGVVLGILLMTIGATSLAAQEAEQTKLPSTPKQAVLQSWNDVGNQLITMANDWPEDKYGYKLTPEVRSFKEVLLHVAGSNYDLVNKLAGSTLGDGANDPDPTKYKTKADVVAFLTKSVADGAAQIEKGGDAGALKYLYLWIGYTEHMGEHYGLLVAFYRASGGVPPSSRKK
ncbi:MAG: DinB family protein [Candidatus Acidiferrales bacterium]